MTGELLWALVVVAGGYVNSGQLLQPYVVSYHRTVQGCEATRQRLENLMPDSLRTGVKATRAMQCIQSDFVLTK